MTQARVFGSVFVMLLVAVWLTGCTPPAGSSSGTSEEQPAAGKHVEGEHEHGDHEHEAPSAGAEGTTPQTGGEQSAAQSTEIQDAMAQLSAEDRALAEKQKVCVVSGQPLGSMGAPMKLDVKGKAVFICCEGCKDPVEQEPDKYLAKLAELDK